MRDRKHVYRRRRMAALGVVAAAAALTGAAVGAHGGSSGDPVGDEAAARHDAPKPVALPRGGRRIFPHFRVVAFYGAPQSHELGALGIGSPAAAARRLVRQAEPYGRKTRPVLPALELLATVANHDAGEDGLYRTRQSDA